MDKSQEPYLIISMDSHVGLLMREQLRPYCPAALLDDFDAFVDAVDADNAEMYAVEQAGEAPYPAAFQRQLDRMRGAVGSYDPQVRLAELDQQGIAAEVMFAGSSSKEMLPFVGVGFNAGKVGSQVDLVTAGCSIFNRALAEFCSADPTRLLGAMQVSIWDLDHTIDEICRGHKEGLRVLNLPAPRLDYPPYSSPIYEPLWETCEELGITLATHTAGGERPLGHDLKYGYALIGIETHWLSRRAVWQLIFSGAFERHPGLRLVLSEQRAGWVPELMPDLDALASPGLEWRIKGRQTIDAPRFDEHVPLTKLPSEYWDGNCFVGASFLARHEALRYDEPGMQNVLWGSDYPHTEGTWPVTEYALRHTFSGLPEPVVRRILGERALYALRVDPEPLRHIAQRIGPTPDQIDRPLVAGEVPENYSWAFRKGGSYSNEVFVG